jgi:acetolactate synthase-1/2/3 large subunit
MGYDLPAAIGAAVASKKKVFCVTGDGSIMMNLQELQTIKYYDLPINVVVFSNGGYAAIRQTSKNFFNGVCIGCTEDTGISFPDFKDVAKTFGFEYIKCNDNASVDSCIEKMMKSNGRVLLEVEQLYDNPVVPKVMSRLDENGKMLTPALHDMAPFLSDEDMKSLMFD